MIAELAERRTLVLEVERQLLKWLAFENRGVGGVLPPVQKLAIAYGVGKGVVREALKRLEAFGIIVARTGARYEVVPGDIAFSVDLIPAMYRAAPSAGARLQIIRSFCSLKWIVAVESMAFMCQHQHAPNVERLQKELMELSLLARVGELPEAIIHQEMYTIWTAANIMRHPGLVPLVNGLVRCIDPLRELWTVFVDPPRVRRFASHVLDCLDQRDPERMRKMLGLAREREMQALEQMHLVPHAVMQLPPPPLRNCAHEEVTEPGAPRFSGPFSTRR